MTRRKLKKNIKFMTNELLAECLWIGQTQANVSVDDINNLIEGILIMHKDFIARLSHVDNNEVKLFFRKLRSDFVRQSSELIDQIISLA